MSLQTATASDPKRLLQDRRRLHRRFAKFPEKMSSTDITTAADLPGLYQWIGPNLVSSRMNARRSFLRRTELPIVHASNSPGLGSLRARNSSTKTAAYDQHL